MGDVNTILENVLAVALLESHADPRSVPPKLFLAGVAQDLLSESGNDPDSAWLLNRSNVERVLMSRLNEAPISYPEWPVQYLIGVHRRAVEQEKVAERLGDKEVLLDCLRLIRKVSISYIQCIVSLNMFKQPQEAEKRGYAQILDSLLYSRSTIGFGGGASLVPEEVRSKTKLEEMSPAFLDDFVAIFADNGIGEILNEIGKALTVQLSSISILGDYGIALGVLEELMSKKGLAEILCATPAFLPESLSNMCGRELEDNTLLGAAFGISAIPDIMENPMTSTRRRTPDVADKCFPGADQGRPGDIRSSATTIQVSLDHVQSALHRIVMALLKNSTAKTRILDWLSVALSTNRERTKMRPDMHKASTDGFMINLCSVFLRLCRPFLDPSNGKAWGKLDAQYVSDPRARGHCFEDDTRLGMTTEALQQWEHSIVSNKEIPDYHFICECFFMTANVLRLGTFKALENCQQLVRAAREYDRELSTAASDPFMNMRMAALRNVSSRLKSMAMCFDASLQQEQFLVDLVAYYALLSSYLCRVAWPSAQQIEECSLPLPTPAPNEFLSLPEYFVENLSTALLWIGKIRTQLLTSAHVEQYMLFFAIFLGSNDYVKNPYLRGKMVEALSSYMPHEDDMDDAHPWSSRRMTTPKASQEIAAMVEAHPLVVDNLVHALVLLFVEIERTDRHNAFYEKFNTRYQIGEVMLYLWNHPGHKTAWKRVTEDDKKIYIRFINMMINDSQYLLQEALDSLPQVRDIEMQMANEQEWGSLPDSVREERTQNLESHRRHLLSDFGLAAVYLKLMEITSEDKYIAERFFDVQVRDRQARILNFFLRYLTIPAERKRLKLKNPEKYGWKPRELISSLALIHANLYRAKKEEWAEAVAADTDYYGTNPDIFEHLVSILKTVGASPTVIADINALRVAAEEAVKTTTVDEENFEDVPEEFEDPLSYRIMRDPVKLPSGNILDRSTILQHLLTDTRDPFSREPMTEDDLVEETELKQKIAAWITEQKTRTKAKYEAQ